jgi:hypothetical protein
VVASSHSPSKGQRHHTAKQGSLDPDSSAVTAAVREVQIVANAPELLCCAFTCFKSLPDGSEIGNLIQ